MILARAFYIEGVDEGFLVYAIRTGVFFFFFPSEELMLLCCRTNTSFISFSPTTAASVVTLTLCDSCMVSVSVNLFSEEPLAGFSFFFFLGLPSIYLFLLLVVF